MATEIITTTFQFRRGKAATWIKNNPVLSPGEPGWEKDTNKLKIGNGVDDWIHLPYFGGDATIVTDDGSIDVVGGEVTLHGFKAAGPGFLAIKGQDGKLAWTNKISVEMLDVPEGMDFIIEDYKP